MPALNRPYSKRYRDHIGTCFECEATFFAVNSMLLYWVLGKKCGITRKKCQPKGLRRMNIVFRLNFKSKDDKCIHIQNLGEIRHSCALSMAVRPFRTGSNPAINLRGLFFCKN